MPTRRDLLVGVSALAVATAASVEGGQLVLMRVALGANVRSYGVRCGVPGLSLQNARGRLLGDFDVDRAELVLPGTDEHDRQKRDRHVQRHAGCR